MGWILGGKYIIAPGADLLCDNEYHSFDKWYGLGGMDHTTQDNYGFQYHVVLEQKRNYYYGMRNMSYIEFTSEQYRNFTQAIADAHNIYEFYDNLSHVRAMKVAFLESKKDYILSDTNNTVVFLNWDKKLNFFYYSDEIRYGYLPNYYIRGINTESLMENKILDRYEEDYAPSYIDVQNLIQLA